MGLPLKRRRAKQPLIVCLWGFMGRETQNQREIFVSLFPPCAQRGPIRHNCRGLPKVSVIHAEIELPDRLFCLRRVRHPKRLNYLGRRPPAFSQHPPIALLSAGILSLLLIPLNIHTLTIRHSFHFLTKISSSCSFPTNPSHDINIPLGKT